MPSTRPFPVLRGSRPVTAARNSRRLGKGVGRATWQPTHARPDGGACAPRYPLPTHPTQRAWGLATRTFRHARIAEERQRVTGRQNGQARGHVRALPDPMGGVASGDAARPTA